MVLQDGGEVGRISFKALGGDYVLAGVVAFGGAGPEEESVLEGWTGVSVELLMVIVMRSHTYGEAILAAIGFFAVLSSYQSVPAQCLRFTDVGVLSHSF